MFFFDFIYLYCISHKMQSSTPETTRDSIKEYVYLNENGIIKHKWNIYPSSTTNTDAQAIVDAISKISDYYLREELTTPLSGEKPHTQINKALKRDHILIAAAYTSSVKLSMRDFPKYYFDKHNKEMNEYGQMMKMKATMSALSSLYQKHNLTALSGMTGLLITRLFLTGHSHSLLQNQASSYVSPEHLAQILKNHSLFTIKFIHSALASEILIGNRYYRDITQNTLIIGNITGDDGGKYKNEDITSKSLNATKQELLQLYASQVDRIQETVKLYKRGLMSLSSIQTDQDFIHLLKLFWRYSKMIMKIYEEMMSYELPIDEDYYDNDDEYSEVLKKFNQEKDIKRFITLSNFSEVCIMVPLLYNYDVAHLFDNSQQTYAKFIRAAKNTYIRLANTGCTSFLLSFAAIEPTMMTPEFAPKHGIKYQTLSLCSCANYISTKKEVYTSLRDKYRMHIPRTAVVVGVIPRTNDEKDGGVSNIPIHKIIQRISDTPISDLATQLL